MKSRRFTQTMMMMFAALALASFGCKKDEGGDKGGEGEKAGKAAEKTGGDKGAAASKTSFAVFPKDSEFLVGFNGDSLRNSGIYKKFSPMIDGALSKEKDYQSFKDTCGFDPIAKIQSIIVGGAVGGKEATVVVKGFDKGQAKDCAEKMAKKEGEKISIEEDGKLMKVTSPKGEVMWFAWLDDSTFVTGSGAEGDAGKAWLEGRVSGKDGLDKNEDMSALLKQVDSAGTIWFVAKPKDTSSMAMMGPPPGAFFGTVLLTAGLKADVGLRFENAENATKFVEQTQQMMGAMAQDPTAKMVADKTKMETKGNDAIIKLDLSEEELGKVMGMAEQMLGPMMR